MLDDKEFELLDETPVTEEVNKEVEITDDDFTLTQVDSTVHEQKFQTKPTTFLKDSLKRFKKNKSSVVATYILGALLLLSFVVPIADRSDTKSAHPYETYLSPKLFNSGTGWWDGTVTYKNLAVDISEMPDAQTEDEKQAHWWPSHTKFPQKSAISNKVFTDEEYTNDISNLGTFGKEGYIHFGYYYNRTVGDKVELSTQKFSTLTLNNDLYLSVFDVYDVDKVNQREGKSGLTAPENYQLGESAFYFNYTEEDPITHEKEKKEVQLVDYAIKHNIGSQIASLAEPKLNIAEAIQTETGETTFKDAYFSVRMIADGSGHNTCSLVRSIVLESESTDATV